MESGSPFAALVAGRRITREEFTVYLKHVSWKIYKQPSQRMGQAYFNTLHDLHPEIADDFRGGRLDPFYDDTRMPDFLAFLAQEYVR